jgi:hypothetical protein
MSTTKQPYEVPTLRCNGDVVEHTHAHKVLSIESDTSPQFPLGSVGYGV